MSRDFFRSGTVLTCLVMIMFTIAAVSCSGTSEDAKSYHIWEKVEITLTSRKTYENPYKDMTVWVDLKGSGFNKRCYGFWDGGKTFRFPWCDDDTIRSMGPTAGFKEYVAYRKNQEYNCVAILAALPNWSNDDKPARLIAGDRSDEAGRS